MRGEAKGWATGAITILSVLAVGGGLALSGGPMQGRKERRDEARQADLQRLANLVQCRAAEAEGALPPDLANSAVCPEEVRRADPFTGEAYRYEMVDARSFRLCAGFELPLDRGSVWGPAEIDAEARCLVWHLPPEVEVRPARERG
ncbi:hypothetical protein GI374_16235 [Paracoccus sp. S-4012]|uniref:hypothetical protein n=1 Tax=Paracoccus sp. S-4012 TaxID=2665648 RepID=UPI0012B02577|nr:hypothetical protein [Paracoccus sp. S-4012]MRX51939.1 hypothetical protein [Paracoccus sp. S-4012]